MSLCAPAGEKTNSKNGWLGFEKLILSRKGAEGVRGKRHSNWCFNKHALPGNEILGVGDEFRVGPGAQLVQIQALALSLHRYPVGVYEVQEPI